MRAKLLLALVATAAFAWWLWPVPSPDEAEMPAPESVREIPREPTISAEIMAEGQIFAEYNATNTDIEHDMRIVGELIRAYERVFKVRPSGDNIDFVEALRGRNPHGFRYLPDEHAAINSSGELLDRWGTPFFFHSIAHDHTEIRSAGPDRQLFTADDIVEDGF